MSTSQIYDFICDRFGPDALFRWKVPGPDSTVNRLRFFSDVIDNGVVSIECWMVATDGTKRSVLIAALADGGFSVYPEMKIQNLDRLALAIQELGEFESAYKEPL